MNGDIKDRLVRVWVMMPWTKLWIRSLGHLSHTR